MHRVTKKTEIKIRTSYLKNTCDILQITLLEKKVF